MRIDVYPDFTTTPKDKFYGKTVVVVHALRSVTSMIWAIRNGADKIVPVRDAGEAVALSLKLSDPNCLQAGEQNGEIPTGFALGNSPETYTPEIVKGKTIILSTSNGTQAVNSTDLAKNVLLGAMINRTAVAKQILDYDNDTVIMCVGSGGEPATEDFMCAGAIINALMNITSKTGLTEVTESDMAFVCRMLYRDLKTKAFDITSACAVKELLARGFTKDVEFCLSADLTDVVPYYDNGIVR